MYEIVVHENADAELNDAATFYELKQEGLGDLFCERLLRGFPELNRFH